MGQFFNYTEALSIMTYVLAVCDAWGITALFQTVLIVVAMGSLMAQFNGRQ
jgi:hypothetical protein